MADRPFDYDIDALHRDAASRGSVAVDHEEAAAAGRAGALRRVTLHMYAARYHIFGHALAGGAVNDDRRFFVHPRAIVADMPFNLDRDRRIDAGSDRMLAARIENPPMGLVGGRFQAV